MKALACAVLLVVLAGCGSSVAAAPGPSASVAAPTPTVTETEWDIDPSFNATDLAWIELMIPMDDQLLRVLDLAASAGSPAVRAFAGQVAAGHRAEVAQFNALRTRSRLPVRNPHEGHDMPGMMTEPEIDALGKLSGPAFDQDFGKNLKEHLQQTVILAQSIGTAGKNPEGKKLAQKIITGRAAQLKQLAALG
ncbi:DUF305 domain-containing protein [Kribbella sp. NPDC051770]|uniref:DUF305 domain-containing protein n=1 Tax=Kribbella sp. NPDC051770 TaxID=3155413 RepID=UPI003422D563